MSAHFSIITTVLNGAAFLKKSIESVLSQTWRDLDLFVIDAGSEDGSYEIAVAAARSDSRVMVERRPKESLYGSLSYGLSTARGDIISWLNADDFYLPWAFEAVAKFLTRKPNVSWVSALPACWDERGVLRFVRSDGWYPRALIRAGWYHQDLLGFLQQESIFFSRRLFEKLDETERLRFASAKLAGDFILWKQFAKYAELETLPIVLGGFCRHKTNKSSQSIDDYMAEVRGAGATFLPPAARNAARYILKFLSLQRLRKRVSEENFAHLEELSKAEAEIPPLPLASLAGLHPHHGD